MTSGNFVRVFLVSIALLVLSELSFAQNMPHQTVNSGGGTLSNSAGYLSVSLGGAVDASYQNALNQGFQLGSDNEIDLAVAIEVMTEVGQAPFTGVEFFKITVSNVSTTTATNVNVTINLELPSGVSSNLNSPNVVVPQIAAGATFELIITIDATSGVQGEMNNVHLVAEITAADQVLDNTEDDTQEAYASILNCLTTGISIDYTQLSACAGEAISFTANETTFDTYQWFVAGELIGASRTITYAPLSSESVEVVGTVAACSVSASTSITIPVYEFDVVGDNQVCPNSTIEVSVAANHTDAGVYNWVYTGEGSLLSTQGETVSVHFGTEITTAEKVIVQYTSSTGCTVSKEHVFETSNFCLEKPYHQTVNSGGTTYTKSSAMVTIAIGGAVNAYFQQTDAKLNQGFLQTENKPCNQSTDLESIVYNDNSVKLNWSNTSDLLPNTIKYKSVNESVWLEINSSNQELLILGADLNTGTQYEWKVLTYCTEYQTIESATATFNTRNTSVCGAPYNLSATSITETSAYLSWSGSPGKTYRIRYKKAVGIDQWNYLRVSGATTIKISNLISATYYRWQIVTVCDDGAYIPTSFTTLNHVFVTNGDICETPINRREVLTNDNTATLRWNSVDGAIRYNIRYSETAHTNWKYVETTDIEFELPSLLPSTSYKWAIMAYCEVNSGYRSNNEFFITNSLPSTRVGNYETKRISISPNPFQEYITINNTRDSDQHLSIQLIDLNGVTQYTETIQGAGQVTVPTDLSSGVYYLRITDDQGLSEFHKIVKQ